MSMVSKTFFTLLSLLLLLQQSQEPERVNLQLRTLRLETAGTHTALHGLECQDQTQPCPGPVPTPRLACSSAIESRQAAARAELGHRHSSSGVTGLETWAAGQSRGGAVAQGWAGVRHGRRPALIGTRWLYWEPSRASLISPGVPATRRGQCWAGCRFSQVWGHPGGMAFHVVVG